MTNAIIPTIKLDAIGTKNAPINSNNNKKVKIFFIIGYILSLLIKVKILYLKN